MYFDTPRLSNILLMAEKESGVQSQQVPGSSETSHATSRVTCHNLVRNSGFEAQMIADLRPTFRHFPGQRYIGASGGLSQVTRLVLFKSPFPDVAAI